jgi:uncharacterized protein (TIGR03435 family)
LKTSRFALLLLLPHVALAQFERAGIRASAPGTRDDGGFLPEGRFECRGKTLLNLIGTAYGVDIDLVRGGADWISSVRFDIEAKAPSRLATVAAMREMLRELLTDRFDLAVHREPKETAVYKLEIAGTGPNLRKAADPDEPDCPGGDGEPGLLHRECHALTMADLAGLLPRISRNYADRPVVDATGLAGAYDFQLDWMSKESYLSAAAIGRPAVSLFDALEKLGLRLEPGTGVVPAIVIDRVNRTPKPNQPPAAPEFDAAEVRASKPPARRQSLRAIPSGQLEIQGYTLGELITKAFELTRDRVLGGPKWLDTNRFDVIAKSPDVMSPHALSSMLKALLAQRFKLAIHAEERPIEVYALVTGKETPKLPEADAAERSECRLTLVQTGRTYACRNTSMPQMVDRISDVARAYLDRPLIDLTGIPGSYDFALTWTPLDRLPRPAAAAPREGVLQASTPDGDLTVFEAIDRQLGLKVEKRKHSMPVIVVDHVEHL